MLAVFFLVTILASLVSHLTSLQVFSMTYFDLPSARTPFAAAYCKCLSQCKVSTVTSDLPNQMQLRRLLLLLNKRPLLLQVQRRLVN
jgi:hypothetical protein